MNLHSKVREALEELRERFRVTEEALRNASNQLPQHERALVAAIATDYGHACICCVAILDGKEYDPTSGRAK